MTPVRMVTEVMATPKVPARQHRLLEDVLDANDILTNLRRDLRVFASTTLGLHTVIGRLSKDSEKAYIQGMHKVAQKLLQILRKPHTPSWRKQWKDERRQRISEISRIQRRSDGLTVQIRFPGPTDPEDLDLFIRQSNDAEQQKTLDKNLAAQLRELRKCDLSTEGGNFEAERILANIEEIKTKLSALQIDMAVDWIVWLDKLAENSPKGDVKPIPHREYLMLVYNDATSKASAYRVSSINAQIGKENLEKETRARVIAMYDTWKDAARFGFDWGAAPRFTVTEYTSGEIQAKFDVDLS